METVLFVSDLPGVVTSSRDQMFNMKERTTMKPASVAAGLSALVFSLLVAPSASAAPALEVEPNDTIFQVTTTANTEGLTGAVNVDSDVDYFWLGLRPQRQVKIIATAGGCVSDRYSYDSLVSLSIQSPDADAASVAYLAPTQQTPTASVTTTTPGVYGGATQYFLVRVADNHATPGCTYNLQVQSATGGTTDAIDPNPPATRPVVATTEPNDLDSQANGPLQGDTDYAGTIDTTNDVDRLYFQLRAGAAVNVRLSVATGSAYLVSTDQTLDDLTADAGQYAIASTDVASSDRIYRLEIGGDAGSTYRVSVSPASSLGSTIQPTQPPRPKVKVVLKAVPTVVPRHGFVTLKGRVIGRSHGRVTIRQKFMRPGAGWTVETRKRINTSGKFRYREDVNAGSRRYKACFKNHCSLPVKVRMRG